MTDPYCLQSLLQSLEAIEGFTSLIHEDVKTYTHLKFITEKIFFEIRKLESLVKLLPPSSQTKEVPKRKLDTIIAYSPSMKKILQDVALIAQSHASVFISGESGTGKEVIAHAIHFQSQRAHKPFIKVNCAAIPETLLESEFFGHEKGAFTGAINKRVGRFELAHLGTLLLDEISEIPLSLQSKLLRAIQEQEFEKIGSTKTVKVDVRFVSTSNREMKQAIEKNLFREDLYFRLNVVPIHLPPLRERKEDILPLAEFFLQKHRPVKTFSQEAKNLLLDYPWPGNIRELANVVERAVIMNPGEILLGEHLHLETSLKPTLSHLTTLKELEKKLIKETLEALKNNKTQTAKALGISVRTLQTKLKLLKFC